MNFSNSYISTLLPYTPPSYSSLALMSSRTHLEWSEMKQMGETFEINNSRSKLQFPRIAPPLVPSYTLNYYFNESARYLLVQWNYLVGKGRSCNAEWSIGTPHRHLAFLYVTTNDYDSYVKIQWQTLGFYIYQQSSYLSGLNS
jgi:hypothetical protein